MDSRIREALEKIRDRDWVENALNPQWAAGVAREALLTAEPEPCEDALATVKKIRGSNHDCAECSMPSIDDALKILQSYATQAADKQVEELRAENERLKARIAELTKPYSSKYPQPKVYESQGPAPQVWFRDVNKPDVTGPKP